MSFNIYKDTAFLFMSTRNELHKSSVYIVDVEGKIQDVPCPLPGALGFSLQCQEQRSMENCTQIARIGEK
jgi:hypothetical protein